MKKILTPMMGIIIGFVLIFMAISTNGSLQGFIDLPSLVITLLGSMSAVFISFPLDEIIKVPKVLKELVIASNDNRVDIVQAFSELSKKSRVNGVLSIEDDIQDLDNEMMIKGLQMVVDGKEGESLKQQLELEFELSEERYQVAPALFSKWGQYAPAFGMIGTLIGLIAMLGDLEDPSLIGSGMATALITTLYGTMLANLIFLPLAENVERLAEEKRVTNDIILEGIVSMQEGQNPRDIEEKLKSFLSSKEKREMETSEPTIVGNLEKQEV